MAGAVADAGVEATRLAPRRPARAACAVISCAARAAWPCRMVIRWPTTQASAVPGGWKACAAAAPAGTSRRRGGPAGGQSCLHRLGGGGRTGGRLSDSGGVPMFNACWSRSVHQALSTDSINAQRALDSELRQHLSLSSRRAQPCSRSKHPAVRETRRHHSPAERGDLTAEQQTFLKLACKANSFIGEPPVSLALRLQRRGGIPGGRCRRVLRLVGRDIG